MGELTLMMKELDLSGNPKWFPLRSTTAEDVSGDIQLSFKKEKK